MHQYSLDFVSSSSLPDIELESGNLMSNVAVFDYKEPQYIQISQLSLRIEFQDNAHS